MSEPSAVPVTLFAQLRVRLEHRPDGSLLLTSPDPVGDHEPTYLHSLRRWASEDPDHLLVAERRDGQWQGVTYAEALTAASAIGQGLLERGLGPRRPLMILSGNSVAHLLMTLGAMSAGVPVAPISVAYSLQSSDHARIKQIAELITPGGLFADDTEAFGGALAGLPGIPALDVDELRKTSPGAEIDSASDALDAHSVAKILFTSGSTGAPKGVITTHGMLSANQQMIRQVWPFLEQEQPTIVDWLPWSHTFGGSHNVGMMLANGGTLYIDDGRPAPGLFRRTLANVADRPPTIYLNVPAGYAQLVPALENDAQLAAAFFSRLRLLFNAAAAMPAALRDRLVAVAQRTTGREIPVTGSWGLTETSPAATNAYFPFTDARSVGLPLPGTELLLLPAEDAYEVRVKGPMVTPGYFERPDLTQAVFDAAAFYRTGDAMNLADPSDPAKGLVFCGRLAEDFKLETGTFVRVGAVRSGLLSAIPVLADAVIVGESRDDVCALAWLNAAEVRTLLGRDPEGVGEETIEDPALAAHLADALEAHSGGVGSAARVERLLIMSRPANLDLGEITDKGYVNQRRVSANRGHLVKLLYAEPSPSAVIHRSGRQA